MRLLRTPFRLLLLAAILSSLVLHPFSTVGTTAAAELQSHPSAPVQLPTVILKEWPHTNPPGQSFINGRSITYDRKDKVLWANFAPGYNPETKIYKWTTDGTLLQVLNIGVGVGALAYDSKEDVLWGGDYNGLGKVYKVSKTGTVLATLTVSQFFVGDSFPGYIDGLTYDHVKDTLWMSSDIGNKVVNITKDGDLIRSFPFASVSGNAFDGVNLWNAAVLENRIIQTDISGNTLKEFTTPGYLPEGLAYDDNTFAPKCALWANEATFGTPRITAFEVPCGKPSAPRPTTSRYMKTADPGQLAALGCAQGRAGEDGIVILDFGGPLFQQGKYGARLFRQPGKPSKFASVDDIEQAAEAFILGYFHCSPSGTHIRLVVGTNNCGDNPSYCVSPNTTFEHGQAWAQMVGRVNQWISASGLASVADAAGGSDMELEFNSPDATRRWADGYSSVASGGFYYNFGDASGCPPAASCIRSWTQEHVWYVSWGATAALPLPEIYSRTFDSKSSTMSSTMAQQWQQVSLYAYTNHGSSMVVSGALTQFQACHQSTSSAADCAAKRLDNTPVQGWQFLFESLNADQRTAQSLDFSTDITWNNAPCSILAPDPSNNCAPP